MASLDHDDMTMLGRTVDELLERPWERRSVRVSRPPLTGAIRW